MKLKKIMKKMEGDMKVSLNPKKKGEKIRTKVADIPEKYEDRDVAAIYKEDGDIVIDLKKKKGKKLSFTGDGSVEDSITRMEESLKMVSDMSDDDNASDKHKKEKKPFYRDNRTRDNKPHPSRRIEAEKKEILKDFAESKIKSAAEESDKKKEDKKELEEKLSNPINSSEEKAEPAKNKRRRNGSPKKETPSEESKED